MDARASIARMDNLSRLLQQAAIVTVAAGLFLFLFAGDLELFFFVCYPLAILLALAGVLVRLFGVVQLYLSELLLLTFVVGAPSAAVVAWLFGGVGRPDHEIVITLLLLGLALETALSGVTSGLWVAKATGTTNTWERIWLMALFAVTPVSIFTAVCLFLIGLGYVPGVVFSIYVAVPACMAFFECQEYRRKAHEALQRTAAGGRPTPHQAVP